MLAGRISGPGVNYAVTPQSGYTKLGEVNSDFWKTHADDTETGAAMRRPSHGSIASVPWSPASWNQQCPGAPSPAARVVDVLVMYTTETLRANGNSEVGVRATVQSAIDDANQSLRNSLVTNVTFSLRGVKFIDGNYDAIDVDQALYNLGGFFRAVRIPTWCFREMRTCRGVATASGLTSWRWLGRHPTKTLVVPA